MSYQSVNSSISFLILFLLALSVLLSLFDVFYGIRKKTRIYGILFSIALFLFSFFLLFVLNKELQGSKNLSFIRFLDSVYACPWIGFLLASISLRGLSALLLVCFIFFGKKRLSRRSVKESFDNLSSGICFYDESGLPLLVNRKRNRISMEIRNCNLLDGNQFYAELNKKRIPEEKNLIIRLESGEYFAFRRNAHHDGQKTYYEILATPVSEEYNLVLDLKKKNKELSEFSSRRKEYGQKIDEYTAEKDRLDAKIYIHDELGKILIASDYALTEGNKSKEEKKILLDRYMEVLRKFGFASDTSSHNTIDNLIAAAKAVGVRLELSGDAPKGKIREKVFVTAVLECRTNTVSHAKGTCLYVKSQTEEWKWSLRISNDGRPPQGIIKEGGGLSSLRQLVENNGGVMTIQSSPVFVLTILRSSGGEL